jgi:hypothetical protein
MDFELNFKQLAIALRTVDATGTVIFHLVIIRWTTKHDTSLA